MGMVQSGSNSTTDSKKLSFCLVLTNFSPRVYNVTPKIKNSPPLGDKTEKKCLDTLKSTQKTMALCNTFMNLVLN